MPEMTLQPPAVLIDTDVSKNRGFFPPKWMVLYNGKPYEQMDDLGVLQNFWKHPCVGKSPGVFLAQKYWVVFPIFLG